MFNGAPMLFRAAGDFTRIGDDAVCIPAKGAIHRLDEVKISEMMPVDNDIVGPRDPRNAVNAKTDMLVNGNPDIDQHQRYKQ